tara:strand:- start:1915 stop:2280 length:366 start_codon:yes stop_codon:yes gene_type:complete
MKYHNHIILNYQVRKYSFYEKFKTKTSKNIASTNNEFKMFKLCWNPQQSHYYLQQIIYDGSNYPPCYYGVVPYHLKKDLTCKYTEKTNNASNYYYNYYTSDSVLYESLDAAQQYILLMEIN